MESVGAYEAKTHLPGRMKPLDSAPSRLGLLGGGRAGRPFDEACDMEGRWRIASATSVG